MRLLVFCFIFLITASPALTQAKTDDFSALEKTIEAELLATKTPGASFAVISGGKIIFSKGFGTTSAEDGIPVNADTLFRMGSTTKMFTAATLATLADQGKLKFDAPIENYIKGLSPKVSQLNAHSLLSQSSGLRDLPTTVFSNDDAGLGQNILDWKDDVFFTEPSTIYSYSSANYWLSGFLTEKIYGKPYADAVADLILRPLGMNRSTIRPNEAITYPLALGHEIKQGNASLIRPIDNNSAKYPGGSLFSSANELSRWAIAVLNSGKIDGKQIIPQSVTEKLTKPQFYLPGEEKVFYGYGLIGYTDRGVKTISHGGASRGYGSTVFFAPEEDIAIIVLANTSGQTLPRSRSKAMEMLLPFSAATNEQPKLSDPAGEEIKRYSGTYKHAPQIWEVFVRDEKLFIKEDGKDFELKQSGKHEFSYERGSVLFVPNEKGEFEHIFMGLYAARKVS